jgi:hypothetical protein
MGPFLDGASTPPVPGGEHLLPDALCFSISSSLKMAFILLAGVNFVDFNPDIFS